jgi:hypothetical protein
MKYRLFKVQSLTISCPTHLGYQDLEIVRRLLTNNTSLRRLDLEKLYLGSPDGQNAVSRLIDALPATLEEVSLRQTLVGPQIIKKLLQKHGLRLRKLDLSYTNMTDSTLEDIGIYCCDVLGSLETLLIDCAFCLSKEAIHRFLVTQCPTTIRNLSFTFAYNLEPSWLISFINRQQHYNRLDTMDTMTAPFSCLRFINVQGSDLFTIKDINKISNLMQGKCTIRHTAILEDETIEGYKKLLDKLCNGLDYKGEPLIPEEIS